MKIKLMARCSRFILAIGLACYAGYRRESIHDVLLFIAMSMLLLHSAESDE